MVNNKTKINDDMVWLTDGKFSEEYFNYLKVKENGNLNKIPKFNKTKKLLTKKLGAYFNAYKRFN